jgi:hypothetical protein
VLRACEFLAQNITENRAVRLSPEDTAAWAQFVAGFARDPLELGFTRVVISHAPEDEAWADWVVWLLRAHRIDVRQHRAERLDPRILDEQLLEAAGDPRNRASGGGLCFMPLLSADYVRLDHAREAWRWAEDRITSSRRRTLFPVRVGPYPSVPAFDDARPVDLVGRRRDEARLTLLSALADNLVAQPEAVRREPLFPDETSRLVREVERRKENLAKGSGERVNDLLELVRRRPSGSVETGKELREALTLTRSRGDVVKEALVAFELVAADAGAADQWTQEGIQAVFRLVELDLPRPVAGLRGSFRSLSSSDEFRDDLQKLAASMDIEMLATARRSRPELVLADAVVSRLVGDYEEARRACVRARFSAPPRSSLAARCDLEIGIGQLLDPGRRTDPTHPRLHRSLERATRSADGAVSFLGHLYLGLTAELVEDFYGAAERYRAALERLPFGRADAAAQDRHRIATALLCLAEVADRTGAEMQILAILGATGPEFRFNQVVRVAQGLWPLTSLPLAQAFEKGVSEARGDRSEKYIRAVRALWIYYTLGFREPMERCRSLARRNHPENTKENETWWERAAIPDDTEIREYLAGNGHT